MKLPSAVACCGTVLLLLFYARVSASGQIPAKGSVEGRVTNLANGAPVKNALVNLLGPYQLPVPSPMPYPPAPVVQMKADSQGRFSFVGVSPGKYTLAVTCNGFMSASSGSAQREAEMVVVTAGQPVKDLAIELTPYAVLTGKVLDEDGEPMQNATVKLIRYTYQPGGRRTLAPLGRPAQTDDRGMYRVAEVPPDSYSASVTPSPLGLTRNAAGQAYPITYYGGVADPAAATPFAVGMGEIRTVDFKLSRMPVARVRGRLLGPDGLGKGPGVFLLWPRNGGILGGPLVGAVTTNLADGNFEISGMPPGAYRIGVSIPNDPQRLGAMQALDVRGDMDGVRIQLTPGRQVRGSIQMEGDAAADLHGTQVSLCCVDGFGGVTRGVAIRDDHTFEAAIIWPVHYAVDLVHLPPHSYVKSVLYGGKEVPAGGIEPEADVPLAVTLSTVGAARLEAAAVDSAGKPLSRRPVTLIPMDGPAMSAQTGQTDARGNFVFEAVRPGKYMVTAWETNVSALFLQASGPDSLKPVEAKSKMVTLEPGGKQSIPLTAVPAAESQKAFAAR